MNEPLGGIIVKWTAHRCDPPCAGRIEAYKEGRFMYSQVAGGFVMADSPVLGVHWKSHRDKVGPATFSTCPFCGGSLPDPVNAWL